METYLEDDTPTQETCKRLLREGMQRWRAHIADGNINLADAEEHDMREYFIECIADKKFDSIESLSVFAKEMITMMWEKD